MDLEKKITRYHAKQEKKKLARHARLKQKHRKGFKGHEARAAKWALKWQRRSAGSGIVAPRLPLVEETSEKVKEEIKKPVKIKEEGIKPVSVKLKEVKKKTKKLVEEVKELVKSRSKAPIKEKPKTEKPKKKKPVETTTIVGSFTEVSMPKAKRKEGSDWSAKRFKELEEKLKKLRRF